jgi:uncharacterized membrane protein YidH (DUF202 family)
MARSREQADKAFARERTILAWNRLGLAAMVCIAVLLRNVWPLRGRAQDVALGLIAAAAIAWAVGFLARTAPSVDRDSDVVLGPTIFRLLTSGTVILAVVAFVLGLLAAR